MIEGGVSVNEWYMSLPIVCALEWREVCDATAQRYSVASEIIAI